MNPLTILKALDLKSWVIVGLVLLCGGLFLNANRHATDAAKARSALSALQAAYSTAEAEGKGLALAAQENASTARAAASTGRRKQATQSKEQLNAEIQTAPDWAAGPIPHGVRDALKAARDRAAQQPPGVADGGLPDS